jgi:transcriptional regulator GlxA family with amidase domain
MAGVQRRTGSSAKSWRGVIRGVSVESQPLWVRDGNIYTSAGISAGIDLALAWVEEDCGAAVAHEVARELGMATRLTVFRIMARYRAQSDSGGLNHILHAWHRGN